jgi:hypothetical protein
MLPIAGVATGVMLAADAGNVFLHPSAAAVTTGIIDASGVAGGAAIEHALAGSVSEQVSRATGAAGGTLIALLQGKAATVKPAPKQTGKKSQPVLRGR